MSFYPLFKNSLIKKIVCLSKEMNVDLFFVGGCVRDTLKGIKSKDIDIVPFKMHYKKFANILKKELNATAIPFKDNVRLYLNETVIDVSKPRGKSIEEDLSKRDFTINNLAVDVEGNLYGDKTDLNHNLIRHVYDDVFKDDPIRIIRAFRFASQLNFQIVPETLQKINREKELLENAANERIYDEICKLLKGENNFKTLKLMQQYEVLFTLYPELSKIENLPQGKHHKDCALTHTFKVIELIRNMAEKLNFSNKTKNVLLLTALFHDIGKGFVGEKNSYKNFVGHEIESVKIAKKYLSKYPISKREIKEILHLIKYHTIIRIYASESAKESTLKKFIYKHYPYLEKLIIFTLADNLSKGKSMTPIYQTILKIRVLTEQLYWERKKLINGNDLLDLNIENKKIFSSILNDVHEKLVIGVLEKKDDAISYIKNKYL